MYPGVDGKRVSLEYSAGLDGVRGLCLGAVLLFHAPYSWIAGGFLGVSTFFTLSGYLITTLMLREIGGRGRVDLWSFWSRRMRRLGPALWLGVGVTVLSAPLWLAEPIRERLTLDAVSAVLFVSNWRFMSPDYAYSKLFSDPSPLQHCWSLAIEAQYYLVFPLAFAWFARSAGHVGRAVVLVAMIAASMATGWTVVSDVEATYRGYYGTDVRAAEILIGALLAVAVDARWIRPGRAGTSLTTVIGAIGMTGLVAIWAVTDVSSQWLYRGGFALYSLFSACVILAVLAPDNPLRRALSFAPLVWIGQVSYGAYIFHWPIFLWLSPERTGLQHEVLFALRLALTLLCAWASYRLLEEPIRRRRLLPDRGLAVACAAAVVLVGAAGWWGAPAALAPQPVESAADTDLRPGVSFAMFGDSTALNVSAAIGSWLREHGAVAVPGHTQLGCSLVNRGVRFWEGKWFQVPKRCGHLLALWDRAVLTEHPDVAIILVGAWDTLDRRLVESGPALAPGDPELDAVFQENARRTVDRLLARRVKVVWLTIPPVRFVSKGDDGEWAAAASEPARVRRLNELLVEVAADYPDDVAVVDLATYLVERPGGPFDPALRSDGVHYTTAGRVEVAAWLGPRLLEAAGRLLANRPEA